MKMIPSEMVNPLVFPLSWSEIPNESPRQSKGQAGERQGELVVQFESQEMSSGFSLIFRTNWGRISWVLRRVSLDGEHVGQFFPFSG